MTNANPDLTGLVAANQERTRAAGTVNAVAAVKALRVLSEPHKTPKWSQVDGRRLRQYRAVLRLRAFDADASLAELAAKLGISKDTYASRLRRAIAYAEKVNT